tara:strand:- start:204 stop:593 length:390 start_codon:yes stop_codon:yes gene_type:complete
MSDIKRISTANAPKAIGPYSQAVVHNGCVYLSGQIGLDPKTMDFAGNDFLSQASQIWKNISSILLSSDSSISDIIKINVFIKDISDFAILNKIMEDILGGNLPARSTVEVSDLPLGALLEIDVVAGVKK